MRPKINVPLSLFDRILEKSGIIIILIMWILTIFAWFNLPNTIPVHFNAAGHVDRHGNKTTLVFISLLATLIYFGLTIINRHPNIFNYTMPITQQNAERQYIYATRMIRCLKLAVAAIFTCIVLFTYLTTIGKINGPGYLFLPLVIGLTCIPTFYYIIRSVQAKQPREGDD